MSARRRSCHAAPQAEPAVAAAPDHRSRVQTKCATARSRVRGLLLPERLVWALTGGAAEAEVTLWEPPDSIHRYCRWCSSNRRCWNHRSTGPPLGGPVDDPEPRQPPASAARRQEQLVRHAYPQEKQLCCHTNFANHCGNQTILHRVSPIPAARGAAARGHSPKRVALPRPSDASHILRRWFMRLRFWGSGIRVELFWRGTDRSRWATPS